MVMGEVRTHQARVPAGVVEHSELRNFLDSRGRLRAWPAKRKLQLVALEMMAAKFEDDVVYTEREVNGLLNLHHTFQDPARLRRELYEMGYLGRTRNGSQYWKQERPQA